MAVRASAAFSIGRGVPEAVVGGLLSCMAGVLSGWRDRVLVDALTALSVELPRARARTVGIS
jgi:hypothetical protein